jgi:putrescine aminotransferase
VRAATKKHGVLLIADEVQTGLGRTGKLWGVDHWEVAPDILATAKSLGGGVMPVSAVTATEEVFKPMMYPNPFMHTTTTGGGALACAAAIATLNITLRDRLWEGAATKGSYLIEKVCDLAEEFPQVYKEVTGKGLLIGQHFHSPNIGYKIAAELFKRGVVVAGTLNNAQTIRIEPPLVITQEEMDEGLNRLNDAVGVVARTM